MSVIAMENTIENRQQLILADIENLEQLIRKI